MGRSALYRGKLTAQAEKYHMPPGTFLCPKALRSHPRGSGGVRVTPAGNKEENIEWCDTTSWSIPPGRCSDYTRRRPRLTSWLCYAN